MRDARANEALERALSPARLSRYRDMARGDLHEALTLYEQNMLLAEAFYVSLQSLEVSLRNFIDREMTKTYGETWLTDPRTSPLQDNSRSFINEAKDSLKGDLEHGKLVAELRFAFWVGLVGKTYDATLWRQALHRCFRTGPGRKRSEVHGRLNAIRRFRNRIAHHEPIFHRPVLATHDEIIEAIGWMCPYTQAWVRHHSRLPTVLAATDA